MRPAPCRSTDGLEREAVARRRFSSTATLTGAETSMPARSPAVISTRRRIAVPLAAVLTIVGLASCGEPGAPPERLTTPPGVEVQADLSYWSQGAEVLELDACLPRNSEEATPAVLLLHGGGFTSGDRDSEGMRRLCEYIAQQGMAAFPVDYRLAPAHTYPAQIDDVGNAVAWLREPAQVERFGIDPARIGVVGSSAGAIIAQSTGTRGSGPTDTGQRVGAVVSLSGVSLMTPEAQELGEPSPRATDLVLGYLGCSSVAECPQAAEASPISALDPSDPPMLLVSGTDEIVPAEQAEAMAAALQDAGVPADLIIRETSNHGLALLDSDARRSMISFLETHL
ncbi:alpha/beta hydrolase [Blastococcus sp. KM273129]|uniref:alpha/beta hydrolase n=1 Tax=Blastococcus sp. KM273129 TaxID=2570315 RepID=UPI001F433689|nr:alpha/beta hydrolase [Blastococcus sp. KM273129]MCF6736928.1 alpha/beta hydrolase [Blastococcus sp. KM273129]